MKSILEVLQLNDEYLRQLHEEYEAILEELPECERSAQWFLLDKAMLTVAIDETCRKAACDNAAFPDRPADIDPDAGQAAASVVAGIRFQRVMQPYSDVYDTRPSGSVHTGALSLAFHGFAADEARHLRQPAAASLLSSADLKIKFQEIERDVSDANMRINAEGPEFDRAGAEFLKELDERLAPQSAALAAP